MRASPIVRLLAWMLRPVVEEIRRQQGQELVRAIRPTPEIAGPTAAPTGSTVAP